MTPLRCTTLAALALLPAATVAVAQSTAAPRLAAADQTPQLTTASATVKPGETLTLKGRGFPSNAHLALLAGPPNAGTRRIGGAQTGRRGTFTAKIRVRADSSAGALVARACFDACTVKASARFRIVTP
ncbi:MAG TPA: hypothetical protein VFS37_01770 [Conexibacter sp.]|nr:hypothetical protein [Conexibacter sp.]